MPKVDKKDGAGNKGSRPRLAANGYKLPEHLPAGEVLVDLTKNHWKLGQSIGLGGFGEIYLASNDIHAAVSSDARFVIKVEPHSNGPLFVEIHCLIQVGKTELIEQWMKRKKLNFLGMPRFIGSGSHEFKGTKYRFFVMERFGEDLQKILERNKKIFPPKTVYTLGIKILDILEYIHSFGYIHADVKASNLLLGYGKGKENQIYLVDFGLACKYILDGKHREYKEDLRKAHDGTIEFTSRDAHIGAHSRRGDLEILGYNMLQWLCGTLPWEDNLKCPEYVNQKKQCFMDNIPGSVKKYFTSNSSSKGIENYLKYVASLSFDAEPDYEYCRTILKQAIATAGYRHDGKLVFSNEVSPPRSATLKKPKKQSNFSVGPQKKVLSCKQTEFKEPKYLQMDSSSSVVQSYNRLCKNNKYDSSLDNPTPAMLLIMQKRMESVMPDDVPTSAYNQISKRKKEMSPESSSSSCMSSKGRGSPKRIRKQNLTSTIKKASLSRTLLVPVSAEDISENKQFAKLLSDLCSFVTSEDNDFFLKNEQREAEEKLKQAKIFYLEQQIVYDALQDILLKNNIEISLHRSSLSSEEKVLSDLSERLANAEVCNYLHSDENNQLFGLSPEFVMKVAPAVSEQAIKDVVMPKIEAAIFKKCKMILQLYGKGTNDKLVSSKINQMPSLLQADLQSLEQEKELLSKQRISRLITIQNYAQSLLGCIEILQQLIMNHRLGTRPNYYSVTTDYLTNKAHALLLKLRLIELRLLCDTYTRDTIHALKVIRNKLEEEEENVKKELATATNTLEMYERVGPGFKELIAKYTKLLQDIENKKWALKTF